MYDKTQTKSIPASVISNPLMRTRACFEALFPDPNERISFRTFHTWLARGYLPHLKVGRNVLLDPVEVQAALKKRFTIPVVK